MSHDTKTQLAILALAKKKGIDLNKVSAVRYAQLALEVQGGIQSQVRAARDALGSRIKTDLLKRVVPPEIVQENEAKCNDCPHDAQRFIRNGKREICSACGCEGSFLRSKRMNPEEHCPLTVSGKKIRNHAWDDNDPPVWSNIGREATDA